MVVVVATTVVVVVVDVVLVVVVCGTVTTVTCTTVVGGRTVVVATWLTEGAVVACTGCRVVVGGKPTTTDVSVGIVLFVGGIVVAATDGAGTLAGMVGQGSGSSAWVEKATVLPPMRKAATAVAVAMRVVLVTWGSIQSSTGGFLRRRAMQFLLAGVCGGRCRSDSQAGLSFLLACS